MPLVGLALGASLGQAIGALAGYVSAALLLALAVYLCWADTDDDDGVEGEAVRARRLTTARGLALLGLGLSISLDELAIGFSVGLGSAPSALLVHPVATLITLILIQTLLVSQLALSLGARISPRLRERVEALTGPALALLGGYQLTGELLPTRLLASPAPVIVTVVIGIPAILALSRARRGTSPTAAAQTSGGPSSIACG
jgi:putative Mn2+ efflux pump MntP